MKHLKYYISSAIATYLAMLCGCNNSKDNSAADNNMAMCEDYVYSDTVSNTHVYGYVCAADGRALEGVLVTSGKDTTITSSTGAYSFDRSRSVNGRSVVKFEMNNYFSVIRTANIVDGDARVDAILMPQESKEGVSEITTFLNREGTTIEVGKMKVTIPANSLVYESDGSPFNGTVLASTYYLNPNSENFTKEMPGGDMSGVTSDGKSVILISYGMVEVTLKDSANRKLQLKEGEESTLSFPSLEGFKEHDEIPLWYFDEEKGTWIEEGIAKKDSNSYVGKVKHFSWHNCDFPQWRATIKGHVTNANGKPIPNVLVTISQTSAYSDSTGYYWTWVPYETPVFVTVKPNDYGNYANCPIYDVEGLPAMTEYTQDIVLPTKPCVHGKVTDKQGFSRQGVEIRSNNNHTLTNRKGDYFLFLSENEPATVSVSNYIPSRNEEIKEYKFNNPSEIVEDSSYNFVIGREIKIRGHISPKSNSDFDRVNSIDRPITVTAIVDKKEYKATTNNWNRYEFKVAEDTKEITAYVSAKDGYGTKSNSVYLNINIDSVQKPYWYGYAMPVIYIPTGIRITGRVKNSCGPSLAEVTVEAGKGDNETTISKVTEYGFFNITLPANMLNTKAKVKIKCGGEKKTMKFDIKDEDTDLGIIDICSKFKKDPDCFYAIIDDEPVRFNTHEDQYAEMIQKKKSGGSKYQVWYKNPYHDATLILELNNYGSSEKETLSPNSKVNFARLPNAQVYLIHDGKIVSNKMFIKGKDKVYEFNTDCELSNMSGTESILLYGHRYIRPRDAKANIDMKYISSDMIYGANKILVGNSKDTKFYTLTISKDWTNWMEKNMKATGFKEITTFKDDEQRLSTIYRQEGAEAIIHRNKDNTSDVTILTREGIDKEPLYHCWKVDFGNSSMKKKGSNINYMWKNETDIAHLKMFGPIMGVTFSKTNISEQRCGCTTSNGPAVAN